MGRDNVSSPSRWNTVQSFTANLMLTVVLIIASCLFLIAEFWLGIAVVGWQGERLYLSRSETPGTYWMMMTLLTAIGIGLPTLAFDACRRLRHDEKQSPQRLNHEARGRDALHRISYSLIFSWRTLLLKDQQSLSKWGACFGSVRQPFDCEVANGSNPKLLQRTRPHSPFGYRTSAEFLRQSCAAYPAVSLH